MGGTDQSEPRAPRAAASSGPRPGVTPRPAVTGEPSRTWLDPTDMADHEEFERARREQELERPPHY